MQRQKKSRQENLLPSQESLSKKRKTQQQGCLDVTLYQKQAVEFPNEIDRVKLSSDLMKRLGEIRLNPESLRV